jgi:hypothetical protein
MATDPTRIADIIKPDVFNAYLIERTAEKSALVQSGIVVPDSDLDKLASSGGTIIQMPFFKDLNNAADDEVLSESVALDPDKITTDRDYARLLMRGKAFGVGDLAAALSGDDPMGAIADLIADYWNRMEQKVLIATLKGIFLDNVGNDSSDLSLDLSGEVTTTDAAKLISAEAIVDAVFKLGDAFEKITAIGMHSVPYARLVKLNLIDTVKDSEGVVLYTEYLGKRIIIDDTMPCVAGNTSGYKYTTYLFGQGAIGRGEGNPKVPVETDRDSLLGESYLIHRRHFLLHPRGIKWVETTCTGASPSNIELALAVNWNRVYEKKNIRIVQLITNG